MFLKKLTITRNGEIVRTVTFKRGLNLVIDKSDPTSRVSGSGVGKTTALRCIDYCLGGSVDVLYKDKEFNDVVNQDVYEFIMNPAVSFELQLEDPGGRLFILQRSAQITGGIIDEETYVEKDYQARLKEIVFGTAVKKPTFRQVIGKFVRIQDYQLSNTIHFLHPATRKTEYGPVLMSLFGFPDLGLLDTWRNQTAILKTQEARRRALTTGDKTLSVSALKQAVHVLDQRIETRETEVANCDVRIGVEDELKSLEIARSAISKLSLDIGELDIEVRMAEVTLEEIRASKIEIDSTTVRELYRGALQYIPSIQTELESVLAFHEKMLLQKVRYVTSSLDSLRLRRDTLRTELQGQLRIEQRILKYIDETDALADVRKLQRTLDSLYQDRGKKMGLLEKLVDIDTLIAKSQAALTGTESEIRKMKEEMDSNLFTFNEHFSAYSERLYGAGYILALSTSDSGGLSVKPQIVNAVGNPSTGTKKSEISAFDLAYMKYIEVTGRRSARFTVHDKLENVDITELAELFAIASEIDGQYIVAVLKERISGVGQSIIDENKILELSRDDKFFGV